MRTIKRTSRFKRDYRREKSGRLGKKLDDLLFEIIALLVEDKPLPQEP
jgi:mRNA interferase YafQ